MSTALMWVGAVTAQFPVFITTADTLNSK